MDLVTVWFVIVGVLWTGYFVLEGFDFGVGMLLPVLGRGRDEHERNQRRRVLLNTIGPVWDGNEVWLLTAAGAMFAAFPEWYATLFSGFYLPLLLILVALIIRNVGIDYRHKRDGVRWRARWDVAITVGSYLPALLWGVALTNIVAGVPLDADHEYAGGLLTLLNPLALLGGATFAAAFLAHGALFVALKTTGEIRQDARRIASRFGILALALTSILLVWLGMRTGTTASWMLSGSVVVALISALLYNARGREGRGFASTFAAIGLVVAAYFTMLFPEVMPSAPNPQWSLSAADAASTPYTLQIMTWVAVVFAPVVVLYQSWTYWVFRKRIGTQHIPAATGPVGE
ncbi:MAG: cytochrome d ubiquinol oxidase subunit II [Cumulibacter sp.]